MRTGRIFILFTVLLLATYVSDAQNYTREQYIQMYKDMAVKQMHKYKIPASITLAQGCLESGDGNSTLARKANNHFGIKCHNGWTGKGFKHDDDQKGECFRKYDNPVDSYTDHSLFLVSGSRYSSLFDLKITDYKAWAHGLKAAGYATNPKYAKLLIDIIEEYQLYKYDNGEAEKEQKRVAKQHMKLAKLEKKAAKAARKSEKANARLQRYRDKIAPAQVPALVPEPAPAPVPAEPSVAPVKHLYTIQAGDTLYSIARKNGTTVDAILNLNPGVKADELKIGTQIRLD